MAKPFRSRKLLDAAKDMPCIRCGKEGETRACHYNGLRQHDYGKGRSQKGHDLLTAELCNDCDQLFTEGSNPYGESGRHKPERDETFSHLVHMTNIRRLERGVLKIG